MEAVRRKNKSHWLMSMPQMTERYYLEKLLEQKLMGVGMLVISKVFLWMCSTGNEDCGAVFLIAPLGLLLLFSKKIWIV